MRFRSSTTTNASICCQKPLQSSMISEYQVSRRHSFRFLTGMSAHSRRPTTTLEMSISLSYRSITSQTRGLSPTLSKDNPTTLSHERSKFPWVELPLKPTQRTYTQTSLESALSGHLLRLFSSTKQPTREASCTWRKKGSWHSRCSTGMWRPIHAKQWQEWSIPWTNPCKLTTQSCATRALSPTTESSSWSI